MARHETDREDLMREATALVRRVEFEVPQEPAPIVAGFRRDGALSIYFGADPAYHFNLTAGLRRAFVDGCLLRTQGTTLSRLTRVRTPSQSELVRHDLTEGELAAFQAEMLGRVQHLSACLDSRQAQVVRQIPLEADLVDEVSTAVVRVLTAGSWLAPRIAGKR